MTTVKIDAWVLEKVQEALNHAKRKLNAGNGTAYTGAPLAYLDLALTLLETAQPQPEVTDDQRKAALNDFDGAVGTATTDYASRDITHEMYPLDAVTVETIRAALSAPAVQEVTVHDLPADENNAVFTDIAMRERKWIEKYFTNNNLRIVRGEGEKS